jgi:alkylation response protein AidB-like acyl-CoA dehydrogenase
MNLEFSEDELILKDSFARFVRDRHAAASADGLWRRFAELGWLALPFAESDGGFGGGPAPTLLLFEQSGRGRLTTPYLATVLLFGGILRRVQDHPGRQATLERIIDGTLQGALAYAERQSRYELVDVQTTLKPASRGFVLNGEKRLVANGADADRLIVTARSHGGRYDRDGVSLVLVGLVRPASSARRSR